MAAMDFDVLVAGAGPAGSTAAALLARQGLRVALLDRARFPREKVCGGGLTAKAIRLLPADPAALIHHQVSSAWIAWRDRAFLKEVGRPIACTTVRSELDAWLVERAVEAGAELHQETDVRGVTSKGGRVSLETSRGTFLGGLLLAADGVSSRIRTQVLGPNAVRYAPAVEALAQVPQAALDRLGDRAVFDLGGMERGYGWIFPKRDHLNVGVYSIFGGAGIRQHLQSFLDRQPLLRGATGLRVCGYAIPVRNEARVYERGPVWLLGDAAGLAEAVWGEGIYFALKSAHLAARAFREAGGEPRPGAYQRLVRREMEPELRSAERIGRALYSMGRFAFEVARSRLASRWFASAIAGDLDYRDCFWRAVLGTPAWLLAPRHRLQTPEYLLTPA